jgi:hypothetical protein
VPQQLKLKLMPPVDAMSLTEAAKHDCLLPQQLKL